MKKLMIAAVAMGLCSSLFAYNYNWKVGSSEIYAGNESTLLGEGVNIYLFNAGATKGTQQDAIDAARANSFATFIATFALGEAVVTDTDSIANSYSDPFTDIGPTYEKNTAQKADLYFAIIQDDKVFVSATKSQTLDWSSGDALTDIYFSSYQTKTQNLFGKDAKFADNKAGWYTASAVPEPTSGLLLLLGVAGLALRRRRA